MLLCVCAVDKCETDVKMEQSNERILKVLLVNRLMKIETSNGWGGRAKKTNIYSNNMRFGGFHTNVLLPTSCLVENVLSDLCQRH